MVQIFFANEQFTARKYNLDKILITGFKSAFLKKCLEKNIFHRASSVYFLQAKIMWRCTKMDKYRV